ncbi:hypothetical protein QBC39DRAFT_249599 [Podospora conica]|nr:hypothetical protein QBC39DRAFT_249599 [Schizothecium conicum]
MNTSPIPVAIFGKDQKVAESVQEKLLPDIEIVHICIDPDVALVELPAIFARKLDSPPASGLGTNATAPPEKRKAPVALFFGGGFSDKEFDQVKEAVLVVHPDIPVIKVQKRDVLAVGSFGPNPDAIAKIYRKKLGASMVQA